MLTKNEIISQLENFNIPSGKPVIVHSSLKTVGKIDGFIGNAPSQLCNASAMKSVLELIYKNAQGKELLADNSPLDKKLYTL